MAPKYKTGRREGATLLGSGCPSTPAITLALNQDARLNSAMVSEHLAGPAERTVLQDCNMPYIKMQQETRQAVRKEPPFAGSGGPSLTAIGLDLKKDERKNERGARVQYRAAD